MTLPDEEIAAIAQAIAADAGDAMPAVEALLQKHPDDARLHFLRGSLLAGSGSSIEAHRALRRAVELEPDYSLARYQLGFFELTSGEPRKALATWGPLLAEPEESYLRKFVEGMTHLIRDEFAPAIAMFEQGIALNADNEPMNTDIRLLIAECRKLQRSATALDDKDAELSATSLMLGHLTGGRTLQ